MAIISVCYLHFFNCSITDGSRMKWMHIVTHIFLWRQKYIFRQVFTASVPSVQIFLCILFIRFQSHKKLMKWIASFLSQTQYLYVLACQLCILSYKQTCLSRLAFFSKGVIKVKDTHPPHDALVIAGMLTKTFIAQWWSNELIWP